MASVLAPVRSAVREGLLSWRVRARRVHFAAAASVWEEVAGEYMRRLGDKGPLVPGRVLRRLSEAGVPESELYRELGRRLAERLGVSGVDEEVLGRAAVRQLSRLYSSLPHLAALTPKAVARLERVVSEAAELLGVDAREALWRYRVDPQFRERLVSAVDVVKDRVASELNSKVIASLDSRALVESYMAAAPLASSLREYVSVYGRQAAARAAVELARASIAINEGLITATVFSVSAIPGLREAVISAYYQASAAASELAKAYAYYSTMRREYEPR